MRYGVYNKMVRQVDWRTGVREVNDFNAVRRAMIANIQSMKILDREKEHREVG